MSADRAVRRCNALSHASSSRVLNLVAIGEANPHPAGHRRAPFFLSPVFNHALVLKHRLRADEVGLFAERKVLATKIIIPFERQELKFGGQSLFVGQKGFEETVRDLDVMRMVDAVPSLDPFLLREHLRCAHIHPDACYFAISDADQARMHDYATQEVTRLAVMDSGDGGSGATGRMVSALLSNQVNEKLGPLRSTLGLKPAEFS